MLPKLSTEHGVIYENFKYFIKSLKPKCKLAVITSNSFTLYGSNNWLGKQRKLIEKIKLRWSHEDQNFKSNTPKTVVRD